METAGVTQPRSALSGAAGSWKKQGRSPPGNLSESGAPPTPRFRTSCLLNHERTRFCCFRTPRLCFLVTLPRTLTQPPTSGAP